MRRQVKLSITRAPKDMLVEECRARGKDRAVGEKGETTLVRCAAPVASGGLARVTIQRAILQFATRDRDPLVADQHVHTGRGSPIMYRPAIAIGAATSVRPVCQMRVDVVCLAGI